MEGSYIRLIFQNQVRGNMAVLWVSNGVLLVLEERGVYIPRYWKKKKSESFHEEFGRHKIVVIIEATEPSKTGNGILFWII